MKAYDPSFLGFVLSLELLCRRGACWNQGTDILLLLGRHKLSYQSDPQNANIDGTVLSFYLEKKGLVPDRLEREKAGEWTIQGTC